jgi:uncharacterized membrane protein
MWEYLKLHIGKVVGIVAGLFFSIVYLFFGFFDTIVVFLILALAYYIGSKMDKKESLQDVLRNVLPENFFNRNHH